MEIVENGDIWMKIEVETGNVEIKIKKILGTEKENLR